MLDTVSSPSIAPGSTLRPTDHPPVITGLIGVLLVNLGTPDATDYWSMRRYLKEFLSDRRVIETPRFLWWLLLNVVILSRRPQRKGLDYASIWNRELDEGPLKTITRAQADNLFDWVAKGGLGENGARLRFDWAMRYGNPSIAGGITRLKEQGCDRILLVPLYPQYSAATTATVCDKAFDALARIRWQPTLRVAHPWYDDPVYIDALAASLREGLAELGFEPEVTLASFHGVPKEYLLKGDPYHCHCQKTARLLREKMGFSPERLITTFQSRFGPSEWLRPYTDTTVKELAQRGVKRLAILTPGFAADCLETIEEIGVENRDIFLEHGGEKFARIDCLNADENGMAVIRNVVQRELMGWI